MKKINNHIHIPPTIFFFFFIICSNFNIAIDSTSSVQSALHILELFDKSLSLLLQENRDNFPIGTISYAQTLDGSIAPYSRTRMNLSSACAFRLLHSLRARHDAILVGINTVIGDQPLLNVRDPLPGVSYISPRPVIIDSNLRISELSSVRVQNPIIFTCLNMSDDRWNKTVDILAISSTSDNKGEIISCKKNSDGRCDLVDCFHKLYDIFGVKSVLIEGGANILQSVLELNLATQAVITMRPCFYGGYRSMTRPLPNIVPLKDISIGSVGGDVIFIGKIDNSLSRRRRSCSNHDTTSSSCAISGGGKEEGSSSTVTDITTNTAHSLSNSQEKEEEEDNINSIDTIRESVIMIDPNVISS